MGTRLATFVIVALTCVGCGDSGEPSTYQGEAPQSEGSYVFTSTEVHYCEDVWQVGKTLPEDYPGCFLNDGNTIIESSESACTRPNDPVRRRLDAEAYGGFVAALGGKIEEDRDRARELTEQRDACLASRPAD